MMSELSKAPSSAIIRPFNPLVQPHVYQKGIVCIFGIYQIFSKMDQDNQRWYENIRYGFKKLKAHILHLGNTQDHQG